MSSNFSANQYDDAFKRQTMQNWGQTKHVKERPTARLGHTAFIADDKGYLLPGVKRGSSWSDFKGTWDRPARIPLQRPLNPTARTEEGINRLQSWGFYPQNSDGSRPHRGSKSTDILQDAGEQTSEDVQQDVAAPSSAAEARPPSQNHLVTVGQRAASRSSAAEDQPAPRPVEEAAGQHQHPPSGDL